MSLTAWNEARCLQHVLFDDDGELINCNTRPAKWDPPLAKRSDAMYAL